VQWFIGLSLLLCALMHQAYERVPLIPKGGVLKELEEELWDWLTQVYLELLLQPFYSPFSGTTQVSWYQKKHSPTHTYPDHPLSAFSISLFVCLSTR